jgi:hypothetical protein
MKRAIQSSLESVTAEDHERRDKKRLKPLKNNSPTPKDERKLTEINTRPSATDESKPKFRRVRRSGPSNEHLAPVHISVEECRSELDAIRAELVDSYRCKPMRVLFQFDALITRNPKAGVCHNTSGTTDKDGDCLNCEKKYELRNTGDQTVRIQVPVGITGLEAIRVLRKTADWLESRPKLLNSQTNQGLAENHSASSLSLPKRKDTK